MLNLHPNPRLRGQVPLIRELRPGSGAFADGRAFYVHVHAVARLEPLADGFGLRVEGRNPASNDSHVCPGGRNGGMRLGMVAGRRYVFGADVTLEQPLTGFLRASALRITASWTTPRGRSWGPARSDPAENVPGTQRLTVAFTIPDDATEAWITLNLGAFAGNGSAVWSNFSLTEGRRVARFFDGDSAWSQFYTYEWLGKPGESPSRRAPRLNGLSSEQLEAVVPFYATENDVEAIRQIRPRLATGSPMVALGKSVLLERKNPAEAIRLCQESLRTDPELFAAREVAARAAMAAKDDSGLITVLHPAVGDTRMTSRLCYQLGHAMQRAGDAQGAAEAYRAAALRDPGAADGRVERLLNSTSNWLRVRLYLWRFFEARMGELRDRAEASLREVEEDRGPGRVFVYWAQGIENAPPVVQSCHRSVVKQSSLPFVMLRDEDLPYWVDLDPRLVERTQENRTHFSDILRIELLKKFSGVWLDATCFLTRPLPSLDDILGDGRIFAYSHAPTRISSWCIAARNYSYAVHLLSAALHSYWETHDRLINYYLFHHVFESLIFLDDRFAAEWQAANHLHGRPAHRLQRGMYKKYDARAFEKLTSESFIHKLTHKIDPERLSSETIIAHVVQQAGTIAADSDPDG